MAKPGTAGLKRTVFEPFRHRFRPFIGGADSAKMPWDQAFHASALANTVLKR